MTVIGQLPPEHKSMDDLCPAPVCPECAPEQPTKGKCTDGGLSLFDLIGRMEIRQFGNETYPGLPNRTFGEFDLFKLFLGLIQKYICSFDFFFC